MVARRCYGCSFAFAAVHESAYGTWRTWRRFFGKSAFGAKADIRKVLRQRPLMNWHEQISGWLKRAILKTRVIRCHTRQSTAVYLFKPAGCSRKSCFAIFARSARSVDRNGRVSMAMDGDKSRTSSRSASDRQRSKIGRCLAIGRAIYCPVQRTAISPPWSNVIPVT